MTDDDPIYDVNGKKLKRGDKASLRADQATPESPVAIYRKLHPGQKGRPMFRKTTRVILDEGQRRRKSARHEKNALKTPEEVFESRSAVVRRGMDEGTWSRRKPDWIGWDSLNELAGRDVNSGPWTKAEADELVRWIYNDLRKARFPNERGSMVEVMWRVLRDKITVGEAITLAERECDCEIDYSICKRIGNRVRGRMWEALERKKRGLSPFDGKQRKGWAF